MLVKNGLEGKSWKALFFGWNRWLQGSAGRSAVEGRRPEQERHNWILRGGGRQEAMAITNCIGSTRAWIICVRSLK